MLRAPSTSRWLIGLGVLIGLAFSSGVSAQDKTVVIASKNFTENRLLGEMLAQLIEQKTDLNVERRLNLGGSTMVFNAIRSGQVDIYPEYTGTGWIALLKRKERASDPLKVYTQVADAFRQELGLVWLSPFGFNNTYAIAMDEAVAERYGIETISDMKPHADKLRGAMTHECVERQDCYRGLVKAYEFELPNVRGMEHGLSYEALRTNRVDFVDAYTTDGKLLRYKVRILEDDKGFFAPYDAAPVVRADTLAKHPQLREVINLLAYQIDEEKMRKLNFEVEENGGTYAAVARSFLSSLGGGSAKGVTSTAKAPTKRGFFDVLWARRDTTMRLAAEHMWLTLIAVLLSVLFAVPIGIWLTRKPGLSPTVLGVAGIIQTIPSLALIAFMIPVPGLGLGARSAIAALFLYALLPIMRNTFTGINEVDPTLVEAARGIGLTDKQILTKVELPLAMRTIMAGIRTSTVISIGVATLAAFIGAGGLGDPIVTGLQLNDTMLILSGAIPAALLALIVDGLLGLAEKRLTPKGLS